MAFPDKVLGMLTRLESRVDALTRHLEARDEQIRQELAICKIVVSTQVMATYDVTPLPFPRRREGAQHRTETPLTDFLTLVGPFQYINPNIII